MRDKIRGQSSTAISQAISLSNALIQSRRAVGKTWIATLLVSLGLGGGLWFAQALHIPQIASSQTVSYDITIEHQPNETYESLVKRALAAARGAVANNLARRQADDVSITVVARSRGAIAPVLNLKVSRSEQASPNAGSDITYFEQARSLLRLEEDLATTPATGTGRSNNTSSSTRVQSRNTSSTPLRPPQNFNPGNVKQGFGNNNGSFSQPGRVVTPSTSGQPSNNFPSSNFPSGQTGTTNGTSPTSQTQPTGGGLTPQPASSTPLNSPSPIPNSTQPTGGGLTPQSASSTPLNSPSPIPNSTSPSGSGLTTQPSATDPLAPQSQPLTPLTPNSSNSTPGIIPSSR